MGRAFRGHGAVRRSPPWYLPRPPPLPPQIHVFKAPQLQDLPEYLAAKKPNMLYISGGVYHGGDSRAHAPLLRLPFMHGPDGALPAWKAGMRKVAWVKLCRAAAGVHSHAICLSRRSVKCWHGGRRRFVPLRIYKRGVAAPSAHSPLQATHSLPRSSSSSVHSPGSTCLPSTSTRRAART